MKHLLLASAIAAFAPIGALAMESCGHRDQVVKSLEGKYSETHIASGFQSSAGLVEIWASESDGTWTILLTQPNGQTCVMAAGTHWLENVATPGVGEPA